MPTHFKKRLITLHRALLWFALLGIALFALSGLLHPLMTWTGPRAANFLPPATEFNTSDIAAIHAVIKRHSITSAHQVKLIPSADNQKYVRVSDANNARYFSTTDFSEVPEQDLAQAKWLASYYSGRPISDIDSIALQKEFTNDYPWVNRLLPVYRVSFNGDDHLTLYVDTELNALGSISNQWKSGLQTAFAWIHTWEGFSGIEPLRLAIMLTLLVPAGLAAVTGIALLFVLARKNIKAVPRRFHRGLGWLTAIPLLAFIVSGTWHLLHYSSSTQRHSHGRSVSMNLASLQSTESFISQNKLNQISLVSYKSSLYYRLSIPTPSADASHEHHFNGTPSEANAIYLPASNTHETMTDKTMALFIAASNREQEGNIVNTTLITRFGDGYDFRNKRLPVWRVDFDNNTSSFVDPSAGALIESIERSDQIEGWSFSNLHKWNFATQWTGRGLRDALMALTILGILGVVAFGFSLRKKNQNKN